MVNRLPIRATLRLPLPELRDCENPGLLHTYLQDLVRAIQNSLNGLDTTNNVPFIISPATTASRSTVSISPNTVAVADVANTLCTLINVLKQKRSIN